MILLICMLILCFHYFLAIAISTHMKEIGQELFQIRNYRDKVSSVSICPALNKGACAGDNT